MALAVHRSTTTAPDAPLDHATTSLVDPRRLGGINPVFGAAHPTAITRRKVLVP